MALSAADAMKMTAGQKAIFDELKRLHKLGVIDYYECIDVATDKWFVRFGETRVDFNTSREVLGFVYGVNAAAIRIKKSTRRVILRARLKSQA